MRREILVHFLYFLGLFILVALLKGYINISGIYFLVGGIVGTIMPYSDHFIYIYLLKPQELSSQRVAYSMSQKNFSKALDLVVDTAHERSKLIFHTVYFLGIFVVLTFWVMSSSGNLIGRGLVLAFYLHLLIDMVEEQVGNGSIASWFREVTFITPEALTKKNSWIFIGVNVFLLLLFSFLF